MIPWARPTIPPVAITILTWKLFCFAKIMKSDELTEEQMDGRTDTTYEISDHYIPASWITRAYLTLKHVQ